MNYFNSLSIRNFLLITSLFMFSSAAYAQKKAEFGIRYMPTISDFDLQSSEGNTISSEASIGYGVGAFLGFNFTNHLGVQVEGIYSSISQTTKEETGDRTVKLKYFNIPLLFSLNSGKDKMINLNASAGLQLGINVGSELTNSDNATNETEAILSVKKSDIGFAYGAGVDFGLTPSKTFRLGIGFRNVIGLVDISDKSNNTETDSYYLLDKTNVKTYSAYIGLSFQF
jgi:opacity protein-like surface antigen